MVFRNIVGYEGSYQVSNTGVVISLDRYVDLPNNKKRFANGIIMKLGLSNKGYIDVRLSKNNIAKSYLVHRLVAGAFIPNEENLPQINHIDGNKVNNNVENLQWVDASGNALHAYQTGLNTNCGCTHSFAVPIIDTKTGVLYCTIKALCQFFGINYNSGRNALSGYQPFPKNIDLSGHNFEKYSC